MSRGHTTISSINMDSPRPARRGLSTLLLVTGLLCWTPVRAEESDPVAQQSPVQEAEALLEPQEVRAQASSTMAEPEQPDEGAANPFGQAATAPAAALSMPSRRDASGSSIADILMEQDPDLAQIQAQIDAGEYEIPKHWLSQKVMEIENSSHRFDPALVRPLTMLGDIQVEEGAYVDALDNYGRAVHVERVNSGLVSPGQIEIVYREANVYRTLGDVESANEREEYAYHVLQRAYDPYSLDMLPGLYHLAGWYERTHNVYAARHLYQRAADVLVANDKGQTLEAIPAWQGVARTYRLERFPPIYMDSSSPEPYARTSSLEPSYGPITINNFPAGERALQTIIQIHRSYHSPTPELAQAILDLADWHLLFERTREAFPLYQIAYELMESVDDFPTETFFSEPKLIHYPAPVDPSPPDVRAGQAEGLVTVRFDITERGEPRRLETLASVPEGMMDFRVRKSIRASRFRPAIMGGEPQVTEGYAYTHSFLYYPQLAVSEATEETE